MTNGHLPTFSDNPLEEVWQSPFVSSASSPLLQKNVYCPAHVVSSLASFTLPFACGDPAPILHTLLCVKVSDAERREISLRRRSASGGSIRAALLVSCPSVNG